MWNKPSFSYIYISIAYIAHLCNTGMFYSWLLLVLFRTSCRSSLYLNYLIWKAIYLLTLFQILFNMHKQIFSWDVDGMTGIWSLADVNVREMNRMEHSTLSKYYLISSSSKLYLVDTFKASMKRICEYVYNLQQCVFTF